MAEEVISLDVVINAANSADTLGQLKQSFKDLNTELAKLPEGSEEFKKTAKALGEVRDRLSDAKEELTQTTTKAGKFQAVAGIGQQLAAGFGAAQSAMALFGTESETIKKALEKVQAAMGFVQAIKELEGFGDAFKNFKTVAVDAFKGMTTASKAFMATGIGLAITAIAVAMKLMQDAAEQAKMEIENLENSIESLGQLQANQAAIATELEKKRISELKLKGATEQELLKAEKEGLANILNARIKNANEIIELNKKLLNNENATAEQRNKATDAIFKAQTEIQKVELEALTAKNEFALKQQEIDKKAQDKAEEDAKKSIELKKELNKELINLRIENMDDEREQAKAKENLDYESQVKEYKTKYKGRKELNDLLYELENKHRNALSEIDNKFNIEEDKKKKEREEKLKAEEQKKNKEDLDNKLKALDIEYLELSNQRDLTIQDEIDKENKKYELLKSNKELSDLELQELEAQHQAALKNLKDKAEKEDEERNKRNIDFAINSTLQTISIVNDLAAQSQKKYEDLNKAVLENEEMTNEQKQRLLDENNKRAKRAFEIQKAASIASAMIATYQSAVSAYQSQFLPLPDPSSPIRGAIAASLAVAAGLVNIKNIASQKFEGASISGNLSSAGAGAGGAMGSPLQNGVNNTSTNLSNLTQGQQEQKPIKAYVLQTDVASEDQKMKAIENKAKIE